ncbi:MAG: CapA family protein [Oscillospiraceae bacterium]|nr:CapA family protein [Oscillospiraceae bacterium]
MKKFPKYLAGLLAAVLVFSTAGCADCTPEAQTVPTGSTQPAVSETEAAPAQTEPVQTEPPQTEAAAESFLLTFVGDCTLGCRDSHSYMDYGFTRTIGDDYGFPFRNVIGYFENDEFTMVNLEGTFCDTGNPVQKAHTFRGPTAYVNILTENSVEAVSLANNHSMDYGQKGYDSTVATLETAGIPYVERDSSTVITTENGLTIGIYGAVYYLLDEAVITEAIRQLRSQADLVVFAPHWGIEKTYTPTAEQTRLAHAAIDAGADIVYGSHPHALQPMEEYNGGIIYYSLGNFSFGGNIYPEDYDSAVIQQEVIREPDGTVRLGQTLTVPVCISSISGRNNFQPTPYAEGSQEYDRVLAKLSGIWK